jgi:hypothetical protein
MLDRDQMTKIEVYGYGLSLSLTEITAELAKELTETGLSYEKFDELEVNESRTPMKMNVGSRRN